MAQQDTHAPIPPTVERILLHLLEWDIAASPDNAQTLHPTLADTLPEPPAIGARSQL